MAPSAKVLLDSISPAGDRIVTFEGVMHRFVLAEFNTHRAFSRNSASSRAIPVKKQLERVANDPAVPVEWGMNRPGMQATELADDTTVRASEEAWIRARDAAMAEVYNLDRLGIHKQIANRLLEPFMWHTVVLTTGMPGLENFFEQRCTHHSPLAQPEMRAFADAVLAAFEDSTPRLVHDGEYHTPYVDRVDWSAFEGERHVAQETAKRVSAARCARVSYLTQDGKRDYHEDLKLYERLVSAKPMHGSPLEHVATPSSPEVAEHLGCLPGWDQLRHFVTSDS